MSLDDIYKDSKDPWVSAARCAAARIVRRVKDLTDDVVTSGWIETIILEEFAGLNVQLNRELRRMADRTSDGDRAKAGVDEDSHGVEEVSNAHRHRWYCDTDHDHPRYKCIASPGYPSGVAWVWEGAYCTADHDHMIHGCRPMTPTLDRHGVDVNPFPRLRATPTVSLADLRDAVERAARATRGDLGGGSAALSRLAKELTGLIEHVGGGQR